MGENSLNLESIKLIVKIIDILIVEQFNNKYY